MLWSCESLEQGLTSDYKRSCDIIQILLSLLLIADSVPPQIFQTTFAICLIKICKKLHCVVCTLRIWYQIKPAESFLFSKSNFCLKICGTAKV